MAIRAPRPPTARSTTTTMAPVAPRPVRYRESDGKPMAETDIHARAMIDAEYKLDIHYLDRSDVYVASNNFLYYEEGNPRRSVSPDVYVVLGAHKHLRRVYLLWEEGLPPSFVLEVSSRSTRRVDLGSKRALYARLGVGEYVIFDPLGEYLNPRLVGWRLVGGVYTPIVPEASGGLRSAVLGLELRAGEWTVELVDPVSGRAYRSAVAEHIEREAERAAREAAEAAREAERASREIAEAAREAERVERQVERAALEAEIARLRAEVARRDHPTG